MARERVHVYELNEPLDRGGPGSVFMARVVESGGPRPIGSDVQFRLIEADEAGGDAVLDELVQTNGLARTAKADGVCVPLDFGIIAGENGRQFWSASPYIPGKRLDELIDEIGSLPDPLSEAIALAVVRALEGVHRAGLRGLGLSPATVLVRDDSSVVLLDPGLGPARRPASLRELLSPIRRCTAPELLRDRPMVSARADLYSVGAILYRCMTGQWLDLGRQGEDYEETDVVAASRRPTQVRPDGSVFLSEVVHALLEPDVDLRFESAAEVVEILGGRRDSDWWEARHIDQESFVDTSTEEPPLVHEPEPPPIPEPDAPPAEDWFDARGRIDGALAQHPASCVGHEDELSGLVQTIADIDSRFGEVLLVEGEAGAGKTRLLDALIDRLRDRADVFVLFGEHRRLGIGRPLQAFSEALTRWISGQREVSADSVKPLLGEAAGIAPSFAAFLSSLALPEGAERLTRESLTSAFAQTLKTLCDHKPVVFIVEDLHWADPEGLDLFGFISRLCGSLPLLLVGTYRPAADRSALSALLASLGALPHVSVSRLHVLDAWESAALVEELVGPPAIASVLAGRLHDVSGGLPLQIIESLRMLEDEGKLTRDDEGRLVGERDAAGRDLPRTLDAVLARRLGLVAQAERRLLSAAAVQGVAFDIGVVRLALGEDEESIAASLDRLTKAGLVWGSGPAWRFACSEVFAHVHNGLKDDELESLHAATADAFLASRNPDLLPPSALHGILSYRVAWHYLLARQISRGLLYVASALVHLRDTWRVGDAERLADLAARALASADGRGADLVEMLIARAEFLGLQGRRIDQREVLDEALLRTRQEDDPHNEARVLLESAKLRLVTGQVKKSRKEGRETLKLAQSMDDNRIEAACHTLLGNVAFRESRYQEARTHMQRVLDLSRQIRDDEAEAEALSTLGTISQGVGSWDHAEELQRAAMSIYRRSGDLQHESEVLSSLGSIAASTGDVVKAEQYYRRALAIRRSLGDGYGEARMLSMLGTLMHSVGRFTDSCAMHRACVRKTREIGARHDEVLALVALASSEYTLGRLDDARDHYGEVLRSMRDETDQRLEGYSLAGLGEIARQNGEFDIASGLFKRAVKRFDDIDDPAGLAAVLLAWGRLETLAGDDDEARQMLKRTLELSRATGHRTMAALALALLALLAARAKRRDEVLAKLEEANDELQGALFGDLPRLELMFLESLIARVTGDPRTADQKVLVAEELLSSLAERQREDDRDAFLTTVSPAREVLAGAAAAQGRRATASTA